VCLADIKLRDYTWHGARDWRHGRYGGALGWLDLVD
jgi:hypothetical protein